MTGVVQSSKHELEPLTREAALDTIALAATPLFAHGQTTERTIVAAERYRADRRRHERVKSSVNRRKWTRTGNGRRIRPDRTNR
jgi:hypothetical protein